MAQYFTTETSDGDFTVISDQDKVLASGWTSDVQQLLQKIHPSVRPQQLNQETQVGIEAAVLSYYQGNASPLEQIQVIQKSGPFRERAWQELRKVGMGEVITYTELAARAGNPKAVRAAASSCATNAAALFVPCHRIVRTDGTLGGFGWGLPVKSALLLRELR